MEKRVEYLKTDHDANFEAYTKELKSQTSSFDELKVQLVRLCVNYKNGEGERKRKEVHAENLRQMLITEQREEEAAKEREEAKERQRQLEKALKAKKLRLTTQGEAQGLELASRKRMREVAPKPIELPTKKPRTRGRAPRGRTGKPTT